MQRGERARARAVRGCKQQCTCAHAMSVIACRWHGECSLQFDQSITTITKSADLICIARRLEIAQRSLHAAVERNETHGAIYMLCMVYVSIGAFAASLAPVTVDRVEGVVVLSHRPGGARADGTGAPRAAHRRAFLHCLVDCLACRPSSGNVACERCCACCRRVMHAGYSQADASCIQAADRQTRHAFGLQTGRHKTCAAVCLHALCHATNQTAYAAPLLTRRSLCARRVGLEVCWVGGPQLCTLQQPAAMQLAVHACISQPRSACVSASMAAPHVPPCAAARRAVLTSQPGSLRGRRHCKQHEKRQGGRELCRHDGACVLLLAAGRVKRAMFLKSCPLGKCSENSGPGCGGFIVGSIR